MKAEIDENGNMTISPESKIEAYALKAWGKENLKIIHGEGLFSNILLIRDIYSPHSATPSP